MAAPSRGLTRSFAGGAAGNKTRKSTGASAGQTSSPSPGNSSASNRVVLVDGCRIPFMTSNSEYKDYIAFDLGRMAIQGLLTRTALPRDAADHVIYGTVIQEGKPFRPIFRKLHFL